MTDYECHNCLQPLSYTGPQDNGTADAGFALLSDGTVYLFCSESCAEWWETLASPGPMYGKEIPVTDGKPAL